MNMDIFIFWGVKDIDKSDVSMWDTNYIGEVVWDKQFKFESKEAQQSLIDLCADLRSTKTEHIVFNNEVTSCWIEQFEEWYRHVNDVPEDTKVMPMEPREFTK